MKCLSKDLYIYNWILEAHVENEITLKKAVLQVFLFFFGTGVWTQGLCLEPLHQPIFVMVFIEIRSHELFCPGWVQTVILLISASRVARITGVSHQCLALILKYYFPWLMDNASNFSLNKFNTLKGPRLLLFSKIIFIHP
jgi:hypothetical protein